MSHFYKNSRYFATTEPLRAKAHSNSPKPKLFHQLRLQQESPVPAGSGSTTLLLLTYATGNVYAVQGSIPEEVFILGDTSFGECCVDEVAAAHLNSDGVVHFGHTCLTLAQAKRFFRDYR